jgi:hypothetical protein
MNSKRIMAIFIGVVMLASILEVSLLRTKPEAPGPVQVPDVLNRTLTPEEKVGILRSGKTLIEYFHNESCISCAIKEKMYQDFVESDQFKGYVILSYGTSQNETADWIINLDGTQIDLKGINGTADMKKLFCDDALIKPTACLLEEV